MATNSARPRLFRYVASNTARIPSLMLRDSRGSCAAASGRAQRAMGGLKKYNPIWNATVPPGTAPATTSRPKNVAQFKAAWPLDGRASRMIARTSGSRQPARGARGTPTR